MTKIIDEPDFIKITNFSYANDKIKKIRRQATDWNRIFAEYIFDKGIYSKTQK